MRMTLTDSLSQSCHPTLTLLIPHVTQGTVHNAGRSINSHLPALVHIFKRTQTHTHAHLHSQYVEALCSQLHLNTHRHPEARHVVCRLSSVVAWLLQIRSPDPFRVLMEWHGIKGDQRPDTLIEERYLVWATPQDTLYCWHFAWQIQRDTGCLSPSYLGSVFHRLEAGTSGLGKWHYK